MANIEIKGPDGKVFVFPVGTPQDIISATLDANYGKTETTNIETANIGAGPNVSPINDAEPTPQVSPQPETIAPKPETIAPKVEYTPNPNYVPNQHYNNDQNYNQQKPQNNNALNTAAYAAFGAIAALIFGGVLWASGMFKGNDNKQTKVIEDKVTLYSHYSAPQVWTATIPTQIRAEAKSDAKVLQEVTKGASLVLLGYDSIGNEKWGKVQMEASPTPTGWVNLSHLSYSNELAPANPVTLAATNTAAASVVGNNVALAAAVDPAGTTPMQETTFYASSKNLNIRYMPNSNAQKVSTIVFATPVLANAKLTIEGRDWYKITTNDGTKGWVNSSLLTLKPLAKPIDENPIPAAPSINHKKVAEVKVKSDMANVRTAPYVANDNVISSIYINEIVDVYDSKVVDGKVWYLIKVPEANGPKSWVSSATVSPYSYTAN